MLDLEMTHRLHVESGSGSRSTMVLPQIQPLCIPNCMGIKVESVWVLIVSFISVITALDAHDFDQMNSGFFIWL